ncbi:MULTISPECIES: hypothetical protein [unclassified Halomonas]|uniref:hypothetical protein n=1 Tax=unclassified Halomonas TaxID=2609666 RepID=UPI002887DF40|nr:MULTISPECIES: hypothetical protein [unclassified Halomonas]MDT0500112.1 hypothetical protein [Halomonas sp. PAR7]MDT0512516.1 hypothetical protein [Halomonas sp. LES1]MDT0591150.1 hypothetical protein [Halomonas sp. PAR8]
MPVTGDLTQNNSYQTKATAFPYTKVAVADLGNASHPVNQTYLSGKQDGAGVVGDDYSLYIATGSASTDTWVLAGGDGTGDVTPA